MKRGMLLLAVLGLVLFLGLPLMAWANTTAVPADRQAMTAANKLYQAGHYAEAVQLYEGLAKQGARDSGLLYNLGNAYYQQGDLARARASYESAARLAPRDPDIRYNLALVRNQTGGASSVAKAGLVAAVSEFSRRWISINELAIVALGAWLLFGLFAVAYRSYPAGRRPALLRYAALAAIVLVVVAVVPLVARVYEQSHVPALSTGASQVALALSLM